MLTFNIGDRFIRTALNEVKGCSVQEDEVGKHGHQKRVDSIIKDTIR